MPGLSGIQGAQRVGGRAQGVFVTAFEAAVTRGENGAADGFFKNRAGILRASRTCRHRVKAD